MPVASLSKHKTKIGLNKTIRAQMFQGNVFKLNANTEGSRSNLNYFCFFFYFFAFLEAKIYDKADEPLDDPASLNGNASLLEMRSLSLWHWQSPYFQSWTREASVFSCLLAFLIRDRKINVDFRELYVNLQYYFHTQRKTPKEMKTPLAVQCFLRFFICECCRCRERGGWCRARGFRGLLNGKCIL